MKILFKLYCIKSIERSTVFFHFKSMEISMAFLIICRKSLTLVSNSSEEHIYSPWKHIKLKINKIVIFTG